MNRRARLFALAGVVTVLVGTGLFSWWNTDVLGREDFCRESLTSSEVGAALEGPGRLTQELEYESGDPYGFRCVVERTSKFIGAQHPSLDVDLVSESADFPFQSRRWRNPSDMSYLVGGASGAVSENRGWVLLPPRCWDRIPKSQGSKEVPVVEVTLSDGASTRSAMARIAVRAAQHVTEAVGCSDQALLNTPIRLQGPVDSGKARQTDEQNACGLKGFSLPESAFVKDEAQPGTERFTASGPRTWACDLYLQGPRKPQITFALSHDPNVVNGVLRDGGSGKLNDGTVLKCKQGDVYVGMNTGDSYSDLLLDQDYGTYGTTRGKLLKSFVDAAGKRYNCSSVTIPSEE